MKQTQDQQPVVGAGLTPDPIGLSRAGTSRGSRGCPKSVIRITLDFESARVGSGSDSVMLERELRVFPFHGVAFQPPVCDDTDDHGLEACWLYMDERGEGVFRAIEVVEGLDLSDFAGAVFENLPGKDAIADIASDYARQVGDQARLVQEGGYPFRGRALGTTVMPVSPVVSAS